MVPPPTPLVVAMPTPAAAHPPLTIGRHGAGNIDRPAGDAPVASGSVLVIRGTYAGPSAPRIAGGVAGVLCAQAQCTRLEDGWQSGRPVPAGRGWTALAPARRAVLARGGRVRFGPGYADPGDGALPPCRRSDHHACTDHDEVPFYDVQKGRHPPGHLRQARASPSPSWLRQSGITDPEQDPGRLAPHRAPGRSTPAATTTARALSPASPA